MVSSKTGDIAISTRKAQSTGGDELDYRPRESGQIVVLGMHRSGTSCITGTLVLAGATAGYNSDLTGVSEQNPHGFWERRDFRNFCDTLLLGGGANWWKLSSFSLDRVAQQVKKKASNFALRALRQLEHHQPWVAKEPRFCVLLPALRELVPDPICVHIVRNPLEVAHSLRQRNGIPLAQGIALWEFYNRRAICDASGLRVVRLNYANLVEDPVQTLNILVEKMEKLGVSGLVTPDSAELHEFVDSSLHRQRVNRGAEEPFLTESQHELWRLLQSDEELDSENIPAVPNATVVTLQDLEEGYEVRQRLENLEKNRSAAPQNQPVDVHLFRELITPMEGKLQRVEELIAEENSSLRQQTDRLTAEIQEKNLRLKEEMASRSSMAESLRQTQGRLLVSEKTLLETQKKVRSIEKKIAERVTTAAKLERLNEYKDQLELKLAVMEKSRSWRITQPLRNFTDFQRRVRWFLPRFVRHPGRTLNDRRDYWRIVRSDFFDREFYLLNNPDVGKQNIDPALHFLTHGGSERRDPSLKFSVKEYVAQNTDLKGTRKNPLVHYLEFGRAEGRAVYPVTDKRSISLKDNRSKGLNKGKADVLDAARKKIPLFNLREDELELQRQSYRVDVVIPIHNALEDVKTCLDSVINNTSQPFRLLLVNDGSDDQTTRFLREFSGTIRDSCELIEHSTARGFTKAANAGLRRSSGDYVVLLNSDTCVPSGWVERLLECGESNPKIGVIGPLSNAASYQSVPEMREGEDWKVNELPAYMSVDDMAALVGRCSQRCYPEVSFLNGFCYAIKRAVIDAVGILDEEKFPKGYGEENDYSIRVRQLGFKLVVADNLYVYHGKSKSYSHEARRELAQVGRRALDDKHGSDRVRADIVLNEQQMMVLDPIRRMLLMLEHERNADKPINVLNHPPLSVLFLLMGEGGSGGAHSVVQEAEGLHRLGVHVAVAAHERTRERNLSIYSEFSPELFYFFEYEIDLVRYAGNFQIVVATHFLTVETLKRIHAAARHVMPAYYVQDYEPWIVPDSRPDLRLQAEKSYTSVPNMLCFAKTDWIRETVQSFHRISVEKVIPSLDTKIYNLDCVTRSDAGPVHIVAMVRASTDRRAPLETMQLLKSLSGECGGRIRITIFGTDADSRFFDSAPVDFQYENCGVLKREEVAILFGSAHLFLDLSTYQAFGRTGLEAMAVGCVPVLPQKGGVHEYAVDGENSSIVDTSNLDEVFAATLDLIQDGKRRERMAENGLRTAAWYSIGPAALSELLLFKRKYLAQMVTIIIPVFNALKELRQCVDSVVSHTDGPYELVLIDDCSSDPDVWPVLQEYASRNLFARAVRNKENLGYTRTVNFGCAESEHDVVLLNSDTVVTSGWLRKLREVAASEDAVATVTPLSNAAGAFSVPTNNQINELPSGFSVELMGKLVEEASGRLRPQVPTGNGFCLYITRDSIDAVGLFDELSFPRGYGEENDFCMRAVKAGYKNLIEDSTFVFHHRSASFGEEKASLSESGAAKLLSLHPDYKARVQNWLENDPLDPMREKMKQMMQIHDLQALNDSRSKKKTLLYFLHNGSGGTLFTTLDLLNQASQLYDCYLLRTDLDTWIFSRIKSGSHVATKTISFTNSWRIDEEPDNERLDAFREIVEECRPDLVHMRHFIGNHPIFMSLLKEEFGLPVIMSLHDHYTVCPTIQLYDNNQKYCEGFCTPSGGDCSVGRRWFHSIPPLKHAYVHDWRETVGPRLAMSDAIVVTSGTTMELIRRHYPYLPKSQFHLIPHGRDMEEYDDAFTLPANGVIRVVFFGALGPGKGTHFVHEMLKLNNERARPVELHVLGDAKLPFAFEDYGVVYHGKYDRESLPRLLTDIRPSVALIPSIGPETYCHVLTEAWASGLPVLGSSLGAVGERLENGGGWILPTSNPSQWLDKLIELSRDPGELESQRQVIKSQELPTVVDMAHAYMKLYQIVFNRHIHGKTFPVVVADRSN